MGLRAANLETDVEKLWVEGKKLILCLTFQFVQFVVLHSLNATQRHKYLTMLLGQGSI